MRTRLLVFIGLALTFRANTWAATISSGSVATMARVFWSGGVTAKNGASDYARANGLKTLEMTVSGKALDYVTQRLPQSVSYMTMPLWRVLSRRWASGATGEAHVFLIPQGPRPLAVSAPLRACSNQTTDYIWNRASRSHSRASPMYPPAKSCKILPDFASSCCTLHPDAGSCISFANKFRFHADIILICM